MAYEVKLPSLGEGIDEATVSFWLLDEGDTINEGDDLVEMSTDKAVFNVPSPVSGTIKEIVVEEGDVVKVGDVLAIVEEE